VVDLRALWIEVARRWVLVQVGHRWLYPALFRSALAPLVRLSGLALVEVCFVVEKRELTGKKRQMNHNRHHHHPSPHLHHHRNRIHRF
jgi:hypothetical protein